VLAAGLDPAQSVLDEPGVRYPEGVELAELLIETALALLDGPVGGGEAPKA